MRTVHAVLVVGLGFMAFVPACSSDTAAAAPCTKASDCSSNVCSADGTCAPSATGDTGRPSPTDKIKNGDETDVDCGGPTAPKCPDQKACTKPDDCEHAICQANVCKSIACDDGIKNGPETDVDCGGACPAKCADLKACTAPADCASGVCTAGQCQVPTPTDKVKNGTETDVDCGGAPTNPRCATGLACLAHTDCEGNGCAYTSKCVVRPSCTGHEGGDTCGAGGDGGVGPAQWESCCASAPTTAGGVLMNKYQVTSGRMRAFLERVKGNVRQAVKDARAAGALHGAVMDEAWDLYLPTAMEGCEQTGTCADEELSDYQFDATPADAYQGIYTSAYRHVGGTIFHGEAQGTQGCSPGSPGTHSYWMSPQVQSDYFGETPSEYPQTVYDTKSLNCVDYLIAQSFCIWDGGRLETQAEYTAAGGAIDGTGLPAGQLSTPPWPGGTPVPFGVGDTDYEARFPTVTDANYPGTPPGPLPAGHTIEWANYSYSYEFPHLVSTDYIVFISAPGRLKYRSPNGHADLIGNVMEITSDVNAASSDPRTTLTMWTANGSWEGHGWGYYKYNFSLLNKYGKQGLRCVYPD